MKFSFLFLFCNIFYASGLCVCVFVFCFVSLLKILLHFFLLFTKRIVVLFWLWIIEVCVWERSMDETVEYVVDRKQHGIVHFEWVDCCCIRIYVYKLNEFCYIIFFILQIFAIRYGFLFLFFGEFRTCLVAVVTIFFLFLFFVFFFSLVLFIVYAKMSWLLVVFFSVSVCLLFNVNVKWVFYFFVVLCFFFAFLVCMRKRYNRYTERLELIFQS